MTVLLGMATAAIAGKHVIMKFLSFIEGAPSEALKAIAEHTGGTYGEISCDSGR